MLGFRFGVCGSRVLRFAVAAFGLGAPGNRLPLQRGYDRGAPLRDNAQSSAEARS